MIYLLYGPDTYRSRQKVKEIVLGYQEKNHEKSEVYRFDCEEDSSARIQTITRGTSLFSSKRLVILSYALTGKGDFEEVVSVVKSLKDSKDIFLVLWDREVEKTNAAKLTKIRPYIDKEQEFSLLEGGVLERWVSDEAKKRSLVLTREKRDEVLSYGGDLWKTINELDKIAAGGGDTPNKKSGPASTIFSLGDSFFSSPRNALFHVLNLRRNGEDGIGIFAYLTNHARTLFTVKAFNEKRMPVPSAFRIHPFVAKKASDSIRGVALQQFPKLLFRFWDEDRKIKTGESSPEDSLVRMLSQK